MNSGECYIEIRPFPEVPFPKTKTPFRPVIARSQSSEGLGGTPVAQKMRKIVKFIKKIRGNPK